MEMRAQFRSLTRILSLKGTHLHALSAEATVGEALRVMAEHDVGSVIVLDGASVTGIFTERGFARCAAAGGIALDTPLGAAMTQNILRVAAETTVLQCMALMAEQRVRYAAVYAKDELVGAISLIDLMNEMIRHHEQALKDVALDQFMLHAQGVYSC